MKMERRLIIDGNAVYELDEKCMLKKKQKEANIREESMDYSNTVKEEKNRTE